MSPMVHLEKFSRNFSKQLVSRNLSHSSQIVTVCFPARFNILFGVLLLPWGFFWSGGHFVHDKNCLTNCDMALINSRFIPNYIKLSLESFIIHCILESWVIIMQCVGQTCSLCFQGVSRVQFHAMSPRQLCNYYLYIYILSTWVFKNPSC